MGKSRQIIKLAFLDSSVLFSAVKSPTGGSAKLFTRKKLKLVTSTLVLTETERNVRKKLRDYHLERFFLLVGKLTVIEATPTSFQIKKAKGVIVDKDAVILASAKKSGADYILTLDQKHFLKDQVANFIKPADILTPALYFKKKK